MPLLLKELLITGGAVGPWLGGLLHDWYGTYDHMFWLCGILSLISAATIWFAAPGKVRAVAGRINRVDTGVRQP